MLIKLSGQVWLGIIWLIGSIIFLNESLNYPYFSEGKPGSGFFPTWLCSIMIVFAIAQIYQSLKISSNISIMPTGQQLKSILTVLCAMIFFIILTPYFGFTMACTLFMGGLFRYNGYKLHYSFGAGLLCSVILFLLFHSFLGVAFPVNDFGW